MGRTMWGRGRWGQKTSGEEVHAGGGSMMRPWRWTGWLCLTRQNWCETQQITPSQSPSPPYSWPWHFWEWEGPEMNTQTHKVTSNTWNMRSPCPCRSLIGGQCGGTYYIASCTTSCVCELPWRQSRPKKTHLTASFYPSTQFWNLSFPRQWRTCCPLNPDSIHRLFSPAPLSPYCTLSLRSLALFLFLSPSLILSRRKAGVGGGRGSDGCPTLRLFAASRKLELKIPWSQLCCCMWSKAQGKHFALVKLKH